MFRKNLRLRRIAGQKYYRAVNTNTNHTLRSKAREKKIRSLLILADCSAAMAETMEAISQFRAEFLSRIEKAVVEAINLDSCNRMKRVGHGRNQNWDNGVESIRRTRLLCWIKSLSINKLFGERFADWHREGPPNKVVC